MYQFFQIFDVKQGRNYIFYTKIYNDAVNNTQYIHTYLRVCKTPDMYLDTQWSENKIPHPYNIP